MGVLRFFLLTCLSLFIALFACLGDAFITKTTNIVSFHGVLLPNLAVDGLHLDSQEKRQIANVINYHWLRTNSIQTI